MRPFSVVSPISSMRIAFFDLNSNKCNIFPFFFNYLHVNACCRASKRESKQESKHFINIYWVYSNVNKTFVILCVHVTLLHSMLMFMVYKVQKSEKKKVKESIVHVRCVGACLYIDKYVQQSVECLDLPGIIQVTLEMSMFWSFVC